MWFLFTIDIVFRNLTVKKVIMESTFRYAPLLISQKEVVSRLESYWPSCRQPDQLFKKISEVFNRLKPGEAFYIPVSATNDRSLYLTHFAVYVVEKQVECEVQGVAYYVLGIPYVKGEPEWRILKESKDSFAKQKGMLNKLSPASKFGKKIDHIYQTFRLLERGCGEFLPTVQERGYIAICDPSGHNLCQVNYAGRRLPASLALDYLMDIAEALGGVHRANIAHGNVKGAVCRINSKDDSSDESRAVLSSFSRSRSLEGSTERHSTSLTPTYAAPWIWSEEF